MTAPVSLRPARWIAAALLAIAACGGRQAPPPTNGSGSGEPAGVVRDTRTPFERRRAAACDQLGPKLAQCAVADSRALFEAGKITRRQLEEATKPDIVRALASDFRKKCRTGYMSSRQVRVLEVCSREETECAPLEACLKNLAPEAN